MNYERELSERSELGVNEKQLQPALFPMAALLFSNSACAVSWHVRVLYVYIIRIYISLRHGSALVYRDGMGVLASLTYI